MARRAPRWPWLLAAIVLLTGALLVGLLDREKIALEVVYPRDRDAAADEQAAARGAPAVRAEANEAQDAAPMGKRLVLPGPLPALGERAMTGREALRRALAPPGRGHVLIDFAALGRSDLARKFLRCRGERARRGIERLRDDIGLDPETDIDTVGVGADVVALGGRLGTLRLPENLGHGTAYGDGARLFELQSGGRNHLALVGGHTALLAESPAALRAAVDRLEGRAPADDTRAGRADIEGVLLPEDLAPLLGTERDEASAGDAATDAMALMRRVLGRVGFRVDVDRDAAMSLDLHTGGEQDATELGKSVRSLLTLGRQAARNDGKERFSQLLDQARVLDPQGGKLGVDVAVSSTWFLAQLGCDADGNPKQREEVAGPAPGPDGEGAAPTEGTTTIEVVPPAAGAAEAGSEPAPDLDHPAE